MPQDDPVVWPDEPGLVALDDPVLWQDEPGSSEEPERRVKINLASAATS